jgi:hypothetical protein
MDVEKELGAGGSSERQLLRDCRGARIIHLASSVTPSTTLLPVRGAVACSVVMLMLVGRTSSFFLSV